MVVLFKCFNLDKHMKTTADHPGDPSQNDHEPSPVVRFLQRRICRTCAEACSECEEERNLGLSTDKHFPDRMIMLPAPTGTSTACDTLMRLISCRTKVIKLPQISNRTFTNQCFCQLLLSGPVLSPENQGGWGHKTTRRQG